jgi:predicted AlkP superfamily phosphohydrolase/phosphomutase
MRTLALGLDGCSWNVLEPLLDSGELPNLSYLSEGATRGVLESTIPFHTGAAWASFATGASPAAHGVYDFMMLRDDGRLSVATQRDLRRTTYYQQLGAQGRRSVLVNLPLDQNGCEGAIIVNSWLTDDESRRILPLGRRGHYERLLSAYRCFPQDPSNLDELCEIEQARFDLARELFLAEDWDHFFCLFSSTDWLGHTATGHLLSGDAGARKAFLRLYSQLDAHIGWFLDRADDATVVVVSDHGQCEEQAVLRVNAILRDLGFVRLRSATGGVEPFFVGRRAQPHTTVRVPGTLGRYRSNRLVGPTARLVKRALQRGLDVEVTRAAYAVDRVASRAFSPTDASFAVYSRDLDDYELRQIREALGGVRLPDGRPAVDGVWTPEELWGRADPAGPTLLFAPALGVRPSAIVKTSAVDLARAPGRGCHQRDGIVLVAGSGTRAGDLGRCSIVDLAPTLLWAMDAEIPAEGDGRVLFEAFDESLALSRPVREVDGGWIEAEAGPTEYSQEIARRLKALGYI